MRCAAKHSHCNRDFVCQLSDGHAGRHEEVIGDSLRSWQVVAGSGLSYEDTKLAESNSVLAAQMVGARFIRAMVRLMPEAACFSDEQLEARVEELLAVEAKLCKCGCNAPREGAGHVAGSALALLEKKPLDLHVGADWDVRKNAHQYAVEFYRENDQRQVDRVLVGYEALLKATDMAPRGITAGMSREAGKGIAKLPPMPKPDTSVSHLDVDLLCNDE